ncbi:PEPxxWA-CTERM sorting domain-containing protein [Sphingomonas sp. CL5.1]|uniref:PEPxxWA-CTERM sorting domain-containing protein n=1 Tax=Sphingomonas sp. CL5.1 TaxID=2653203 RepID=UPI0015831A94|nr:PEPxxWA-CTERM sorting domain-containing protein [Sphingomonas sp. CL5.1]QKR99651.1 PEPxxWA-CTERM sorting domain-containing protein [Sphingomonas sp. CL5.1]
MHIRHVLATLGALALGPAAHAAAIADFELNGTLNNSAGGSVALVNNGGALGASGITFGLNQGPTITGLGALSAYTIDVGFTLDSLNGPRGNGYVKLIDFSNLTSDSGYYSYYGHLNAYPLSDSTNAVFTADSPVRLTLSRDSAGLITAYIDGTQIYAQSDSTNQSKTLIDGLNPLTFFTDDTVTASGEASSGFVDYIRIFDSAITPGQANPVGVPEPSTWAMMIVGFGLVAAAARRRKAIPRPA